MSNSNKSLNKHSTMRLEIKIENAPVPVAGLSLTLEGDVAQVQETLSKLMQVFALPPSAQPPNAEPLGEPHGEAQIEPQAEAPAPDSPAPAENGIHKLSYSSLALLFRCNYAFHLKRQGVEPAESEELRRGKDLHRAVAAALRGEAYDAEFAETATLLSYVQDTIEALRAAPDLRVEPRAEIEVGGVLWEGYADAIANETIYEFKTTSRIPTAPTDSHKIQASIYATLFGAKKAKLIYVSQTRMREFEIEPLPEVAELFSHLSTQVRDGVPPIPTGLTHPYGCEGCGYRAACKYFQFLQGEGFSEVF